MFKFRIKRNPVIGDKFSSRHGQKGVLSNLWPQENMPFTESGITPDIIINPHAFPSRMTIGMLIESLAGKSGSMHGKFQEVSAFQQFEDDDIIGFFGKELLEKGYNYCGNEVMYSGVSGLQLKADIFVGVVYYQRLRHMVNDKAQARSTGKIDVLTRQPVKGRKNQGGIRFGEMERDSLLSHGVSYCLKDRLFNCSDYSEGKIF
jgi:DNA-directed RNA polymerase I subunit RPA2